MWLCDPLDCSLSGSSIQGIFQARILEWIAISSSRGSSRTRDKTPITCSSCIHRQILYYQANWEVPLSNLLRSKTEKKNIHELNALFSTECSILKPTASVQLYLHCLLFLQHAIWLFVVSDGSSKSPSFHLPAVPKKLPVCDHVGKAQ